MSTTNTNLLVLAEISVGGVEVTWQDGHKAHFLDIWLRHSPGFPGAQRPAGPDGRFPHDKTKIAARDALTTDDGDLQVEWSDGSRSQHDATWLRAHEYGNDAASNRRRQVFLWDTETARQHNHFDYSSIEDDAATRVEMFEQLLDHGVALLQNTPTSPNSVIDIAGWFGHVPANLYADDSSHPQVANVRVDPRVTVATNMCHFLGPHTDTCWRQTLCGLLLLHCLEAHPGGGRSIVVDGFAVAERLRETDSDAFDFLARVPLEFGAQVDNGDDWRVQGRVLSVAADGVLEGVRYNGNSIGQLELPAEQVEAGYHALQAFESILYDRSLWWQPQLQPGDLLVLDNHRVLHGREAFDPKLGERHLQSCSVDRDDFHNRYRRLAKQLSRPGWNQRLSAGVI